MRLWAQSMSGQPQAALGDWTLPLLLGLLLLQIPAGAAAAEAGGAWARRTAVSELLEWGAANGCWLNPSLEVRDGAGGAGVRPLFGPRVQPGTGGMLEPKIVLPCYRCLCNG